MFVEIRQDLKLGLYDLKESLLCKNKVLLKVLIKESKTTFNYSKREWGILDMPFIT